jgi:hypothetical protein
VSHARKCGDTRCRIEFMNCSTVTSRRSSVRQTPTVVVRQSRNSIPRTVSSMSLPASYSGTKHWTSSPETCVRLTLSLSTHLMASRGRSITPADWRGGPVREERDRLHRFGRDHCSRRQDSRSLCIPRFNAVSRQMIGRLLRLKEYRRAQNDIKCAACIARVNDRRWVI